MILSFAEGEPFATGAAPYDYGPAGADNTPRLLLQVEFEGIQTTSVVDTGAPYVICAPAVAQLLNLKADAALEQVIMLIRGQRIPGNLYRLTVSFLASQGDQLDVEATVFVPRAEAENGWENMPSFIGLLGCLDRMRFAVDAGTETFYFGSQW